MVKAKLAKKALALMLAAGMMFSVTACGANGDNSGDSNRKDANSIVEDNKATDPVQEDTQEETERYL